IVRALSGTARAFGWKSRTAKVHPIEAVECPDWWFSPGFLALSPIVIFLMWWLFAIPLWAGLIAAPLAVVMGFVASRVTGETDVTPTKALGPSSEEHTSELQPH